MGRENENKKSFLEGIIYFIVKIKGDDIFALGAQLAYYLMLSFFLSSWTLPPFFEEYSPWSGLQVKNFFKFLFAIGKGMW